MKCPICNTWSDTLETRKNEKDNTVWRRKECGNMHIFTTLEKITEGETARPNKKGMVATRLPRTTGN